MTTVSAFTGTPATSSLLRPHPQASQAARDRFVLAEQVYDPVLDPAVNPALRVSSQPIEEITVTAKRDDSNYSFWDFLDLINPLQHIPGVNTIYRELTGDTIKTPVQLIGATVLGGPIGFAAAMVDSLIEESTGKDIGEHTLAMFKDPAPTPSQPGGVVSDTMLADAREFIPDDYRAAQVATLTSPTRPATQTAPGRQTANTPEAASVAGLSNNPTEAEAFIKTAQIAGQANVFPTFKRTGSGATGGLQERRDQDANMQVAAAAATTTAAQVRFMPIHRTGVERAATVRNDSDATSTGELRARNKFAPGPVAMGRPAMAPMTLAAATASQNKIVRAESATAQEAYAYGRDTATGNAPAEMPAWFDDAMLGAIDKYKAMQDTR